MRVGVEEMRVTVEGGSGVCRRNDARRGRVGWQPIGGWQRCTVLYCSVRCGTAQHRTVVYNIKHYGTPGSQVITRPSTGGAQSRLSSQF